MTVPPTDRPPVDAPRAAPAGTPTGSHTGTADPAVDLAAPGAPGAGPAALWPARVPWRAVAVVLLVAVALSWAVTLPLWTGDGLASPLLPVLASVMMWTPAAGVLVACLVLRVPARDRWRALGVRPTAGWRRAVGMSVLGLLVPPVLVAVGIAVSAALGLVRLDLTGFSGYAAQLEATLPGGALPGGMDVRTLVLVQLVALPLGALVNSLLAFGEEIGWRGWLLPALLPLGTWPALLLGGVVWGLWHAPVILLGYNFGRPDVTGLLLMVGGCVAWGVLLGWLRLSSGSVWPAVVAHGSLNAAGSMVLLVVAAGVTPDMGVVGPLGVVAWGVLGVVAAVLALTGQLGRRGRRGATPA